jgi:rod shape-determining protein MreC
MSVDRSQPVLIIKKWFSGNFGFFQEGISWFPRLLSIRKDYQSLMCEIGKLSFEKNLYREALIENVRLRRLIGFKEHSKYEFIPTEVIGRGMTSFSGSVHLNIGWSDSCRKNMVMITDRGLVGKIISLSKSTSVGQLITDPNFRVSAKLHRSRVLGIIKWMYGNICLLEGVPKRSDVRIGDSVITSGYSQIYPPGIVIGKIFDISSENEGLFLRILVRTEVDFETLEELLVLKEVSLISQNKR